MAPKEYQENEYLLDDLLPDHRAYRGLRGHLALQDHQDRLQDHQNHTNKEPPQGGLLIGRVLMVLEVVLVVLEVVLVVLGG